MSFLIRLNAARLPKYGHSKGSVAATRFADVASKSVRIQDGHGNKICWRDQHMATLYYQGHGSFRITSNDGKVVYVDPYAGGGYDLPADVVLVTHQHGDHNQIHLCTQKPDCRIITNVESLEGGKHNSFNFGNVIIQAVEAQNKNHNPAECVGFIITVDGVKIYASGDTSKTEQMETFAEMELDYAILCGDGVYNMNPEEAAECARLIGAKHNILIHVKPKALFDRDIAEKWDAPNKIIVEPGQTINL
jgi:L-ascorbate metabolism protein UlaG (beta-lactamase superfamily)